MRWAARQREQAPQVVPGALVVRRALNLLCDVHKLLIQQLLQSAIVAQRVLRCDKT